MNTHELEGALLDYWVAKAEGLPLGCDWDQGDYILVGTGTNGALEEFSPSTDWAQGGPIIERERIELIYYGKGGDRLPARNAWDAQIGCDTHYIDQGIGDATGGPTPLIAAMRALVAFKFGEDVTEATP